MPKYKTRSSVKSINIRQDIKKNLTKPVKMGYSTCQAIYKLICFCCKKKQTNYKHQLFKKAKKKFKYNMNILTYMRKIQEIDILKHILLDEKQMTLLNFLSKPSISLLNKHNIHDNLHGNYNVDIGQNKIDNIYENYNAIFTREHGNDIDQKLLDMVSYEVDNLILG